MAASYSEMTAKGADGLLVEEGSGFGSKPDKYYGRSPAGVAIVALCLLLCLGVVALVTYCTVQSLRNEEHVRHLEREMERLKHQVVSQYGSRSVDRGYERNSDPYDYRVYGDDTDDGYGGNDDWYGVYDRRFQGQDSSGDHPDDLIDRDDFSFDGDQGAAASRTKRSVIRKNKKEHRTERPRKGNRKGSRKGRNKLNKDNLNKYIEVHFHDTAAYLGYNVQKASRKTDPRTLFSCYTSVEPIMHEADVPGVKTSYSRYEACSVNGLAELDRGDSVYLRMANRHIRIGAVAQMSSWGLIRISSRNI
ncbi:hypothetical protein LSH36_473g01004 [Paralvinella palmiformis]|uniref:Uncharacterized protein n=1 Tax=Paralvinella palmiformis TaxID=53620 RepID=A0AAD9JA52_9ANNE|nr:hypothetical protein LSH36_473g01004 [Paralvinella palmiformis]